MTSAFVTRCALAACLLAPVPALAQSVPSPAPSASPADTEPPEIGRIVTSDRRPEPIAQSSRPTFVVDRATMDAFGTRTVADALASVPGVDLFSYGPFGAQTDYGIRGTTSPQTLVLRDGIPISNASSGTIDLGSLSTEGVSRIEVVESGSSTLYGSNATGGVINILSAPPARSSGRIAFGSFGDTDVAGTLAGRGFSLSYERHVAQNAYAYPALAYGPGPATFPAGTRTNADAEQSAIRLGYVAPLGSGWSVCADAGDDAIHIGVPGSLAFPTTQARQETARSDGALTVAHTAANDSLSLTVAGSTQRLLYRDPQNGGESDTYDGRMQLSLKNVRTMGRFDLVWGLDTARESALLSLGPAGPPPDFAATESQSALYAQATARLGDRSRISAGLRAENDTPRAGVIAPSFGATIGIGSAKLAANVAESFRVPTLIDLYYPGFSNPSLAPERLTNYDATLSFPAVGTGVSFGIFGRSGSNLITVDQTTFIPFNARRALVNGFAVTAGVRATPTLRLSGSITNVYRALDATTNLRLPRTPPIVATLALERDFAGGPFAFGVRARLVGSDNDNGPSPQAVLDRYATADAYVRYRVEHVATATLRVRNASDARYAPIYGYPAPGRSVNFELSTP